MSTAAENSAATTLEFTLREVRTDEVVEVFELIDQEGWNLTLPKLRRMHELMPEAFFVLVDKKDAIAATFSLLPTFPGERVVGNVVVTKSQRGAGLGRKILTQYAHEAAKCKGFSLTSVPQARGFYTKIGMKPADPPQNQVVFHLMVNPEDVENKVATLGDQLKNVRFGVMDKSRFDDVLAYDKESRGGYDSSVCTTSALELCHIAIADDTATNKLVGYAASFVTRDQIVIDGLFADSEAIALALYSQSLRTHPGVPQVKLQLPECQQTLAQFGEVKDTYQYLRFAYGTTTPVREDRTFCVSDCDYSV